MEINTVNMNTLGPVVLSNWNKNNLRPSQSRDERDDRTPDQFGVSFDVFGPPSEDKGKRWSASIEYFGPTVKACISRLLGDTDGAFYQIKRVQKLEACI